MNKEPKTLPQAIKIIVGIYGKDVVKDVRMVNIMNDVVSLEDPNAVKTILKDCIRLGYGGKILSITPKDDFRLKIKAFSKEISDSHGYKDVIVQYILFSIAFGVGICLQEPYLRNRDIHQQEEKVQLTPENETEEETIEERTVPYKSIAACVAVLVAVVFGGFRYLSSSAADKEQYEKHVFSGNSFLNSGDYENAVDSYKEAYNGGSHKKDALEKIDDLADRLIKEGETDGKCLLQAQKVLKSELQLDLSNDDRDRITFKLNDLENTINGRTYNGRNALITNLSANNGKLDENGKKLLDDLLLLAPNDYWLNFIKKKSYE